VSAANNGPFLIATSIVVFATIRLVEFKKVSPLNAVLLPMTVCLIEFNLDIRLYVEVLAYCVGQSASRLYGSAAPSPRSCS